ncbi:MAG: OmpA family protein [Gammaproteobacteria bacterium]|nr:OmpA family protein [Gammaproteobacteria bacterium]
MINLPIRLVFSLAFVTAILFGCVTAKEAPEPEPEPIAATPAEPEPLDGDDDNDGVPNSRDKCPDTRPGVKVDNDGCEIILELQGVLHFEFDSARLTPEGEAFLDGAIDTLNQWPFNRVEIAGHTDSTGPESYNQGLSERRANSVRDYLVSGGIDDALLITVGYGESNPVATNDTREGRAKNRRVEITDRSQ